MQPDGIQELTAKRLDQLVLSDLRDLATFARTRLRGLPPSAISAEDAVQKTLLHVIRGTQRATPPRRPTSQQVRDKAAFMKYMKSAITNVIAGAERKQAVLPIHEPLFSVDATQNEQPLGLVASLSPENSITLQDLKREVFSRLRTYAPPRLLPIINQWERTFFWTNQMPRLGPRGHRTQVRMLAMQVLKEIDEKLG